MKVLVAVASRHGSTRMVGDCIREELEATGVRAHLGEPQLIGSLDEYDAVVLGSAVYAGRWLAAARQFADRYESQLQGKPVWLFSSGPIGQTPKPIDPPAEAVALATRLHARDHRVFAGRLDRDVLGTGERLVIRVVGAPTGDFRKWEEVGAWARGISAALKAEVPLVQAAS